MTFLEQMLTAAGHDVQHVRIRFPGDCGSQVTDTFDATTGELFELKATASRNAVRTAIGQFMDYRRHIPDACTTAIALPERPQQDLVDLINTAGIGLVHRTPAGQWTRVHHGLDALVNPHNADSCKYRNP